MAVVRILGGNILPEHSKWIDDQKLIYRYHWSYVYEGYNVEAPPGGMIFVKTRLVGINLPDEFALLFKLKFSLKD